MAYQAQETFVAEIDGAPLYVQRGQVYANDHPVVKLDAGRDLLFRPLDIDASPAAKAPILAKAAKAKAAG
jgi:hypothetical protein